MCPLSVTCLGFFVMNCVFETCYLWNIKLDGFKTSQLAVLLLKVALYTSQKGLLKMVLKTLTIGGSDTWGGGGIQTDLRTFENLNTFGLTVLTCIAVEEGDNFAIRALSVELVKEQLQTIEKNFQLDGVKIGLLATVEIVEVVIDFCRRHQGEFPIILDPVLAFKETQEQLAAEYIEKMKTLFPLVDLITPNRNEAQLLANSEPIETLEAMVDVTKKLADQIKVKMIVTGGGLIATDLYRDGMETRAFTGPLSEKKTNHGAGCSFSSAICSHLAQDFSLFESIDKSKKYVFEAIENGVIVGDAGNVWHPITHEEE